MSNCYNSELPIGPPGPTGPQGLQGQQGLNGTAWLSGVTEPDPNDGVYNDYYLNTSNGFVYIKQYVGLALEWVYTTTIKGTNGAPGENGDPGLDGTTLVYILYGEDYVKSLGISNFINYGDINVNFYGQNFYFDGNALCPEDDSVVRITLFYEASNRVEEAGPTSQANIFYNFVISDDTSPTPISNGVVGGPLPSAFYNNTYPSTNGDSGSVFTKVCYTIRRKTLTTAEVFTEWSSSRVENFDLYNAEGQYYTQQFLTSGLDFTPGTFNEFKFFPTITDSVPSTSPKARVISFYIEQLN